MKTTTLILFALSLVFLATAQAQQVFWTYSFGGSSSSSRVATNNFNGTNSTTTLFEIGSRTRDLGILRAADKLYVATPTSIIYSNIDGSSLNQNFVTGLTSAYSIGIDSTNSHIYFSSSTGISRIDVTTGTGVATTLVSSEGASSLGLAIDAANQHIYYLDPGANALKSVDFDGNNVTTLASGGVLNSPNGISLDRVNGRIYVSNAGDGDINRFSLTGTFIDTVRNNDGARGVAVAPDVDYIFYGKQSGSDGNLRRAALDGSGGTTIDSFGFGFDVRQVAVIPEPSTYALILGIGAMAMLLIWKRRRIT